MLGCAQHDRRPFSRHYKALPIIPRPFWGLNLCGTSLILTPMPFRAPALNGMRLLNSGRWPGMDRPLGLAGIVEFRVQRVGEAAGR